MKKKVLFIFLSIISLVFVLVAYYGNAYPSYGQTGHESGSCHNSPGGYTITSTLSGTITTDNSTIIIFNVSATGSNLFVQAYPGAKDNNQFNILPTTGRMLDGSGNDIDPSSNAITVVFNITTPAVDEFYTLFILAGDDSASRPTFAYLEIEFSIGGVGPPGFDFSNIFDHLGLYLGMPALILLSLGTVLVLVNENKFVKLHGIFAGSSWILTSINVAVAFIKIPAQAWLTGYELIYHLPHIVLGAIGLVAGFFSMLFGIAAERKPAKLTGYLTLICWWAAFFTGYLLNSNLLLI